VLAGILEEFLYAVHVAVVGYRQGGHAHFLRPLEQGVDRRETVKYRVLGMDVKMYESHGRKNEC
jgi:hypothetical protein